MSNVRIHYGTSAIQGAEPTDLEQRVQHARALLMKNDLAGVRAVCAEILKADPTHPKALSHLACACLAEGQYDEARSLFQQSLAANPSEPQTHNNLGIVYYYQSKHREAAACFTRAIELNRNFSEAYVNRGNALKKLRDFQGSLADHETALLLNPGNAVFHSNKGNLLLEMARLSDATTAFEAALGLNASLAEAHFGKAQVQLLQGNFDGLEDYEWRFRLSSNPARTVRPDIPPWHEGEPIAGKRILIHWEQGLGDTIQFCRYLRDLSGRGAKVYFSPQRSLLGLMRSIDADVTLIGEDQCAGAFDYRLALLSCPRAFRTRLETIPARVPYLRAEPERVASWRQRIGPYGFRIGICWRANDSDRSFDVSQFAALSGLPGVRLISLQKAARKDWGMLPAGLDIEDLGDDFDSGEAFLDTAAVMSVCDLVISCDTSIAHLAGALDIPVWVALKSVPDWRWLLSRSDSPWYPAMRLFRQHEPGDWQGVFAQMRRALEEKNDANY